MSTTVKKYEIALVVDVDGVGEEILSLPIIAKLVHLTHYNPWSLAQSNGQGPFTDCQITVKHVNIWYDLCLSFPDVLFHQLLYPHPFWIMVVAFSITLMNYLSICSMIQICQPNMSCFHRYCMYRNNFIHWWLTMIFLPPFSIHFIEITFPSQVVEDVTPILYTSPEPKVGLTKYLKDSSSKWPFTSLFLFLGY